LSRVAYDVSEEIGKLAGGLADGIGKAAEGIGGSLHDMLNKKDTKG
jgi:hypothetical protein